ELKIYFAGKDEPLIIPVRAVATDRRSVLGEIATFSLEMFNVPIIPFHTILFYGNLGDFSVISSDIYQLPSI
ncbi:hypothetical protein, partial [Thermococcus sp.]